MVQLQNDLIFKLQKKRKKGTESNSGDKREMRKQTRRGIEGEINYASIIKVSLLLLYAVSQEIDGVCVCASISVQSSMCVSMNVNVFRRLCVYIYTIFTRFCMYGCKYLVEVSRVWIFTSDHVEEDGNGGPPQLLLWDQSHLQDGTHHARDEADLVTAWKKHTTKR